MTPYKHPTRPPKRKQRHTSKQNERFIKPLIFILLAGVTVYLNSCTPAQPLAMQCNSKPKVKQSDYTQSKGNILGNVCGNADNTQGNVLGNVTSNATGNDLWGNSQRPQANFSKNRLLLAGVLNDNKALSKTQSGQASRYFLAFFMPSISPASQAGEIDSIAHLPQFTGVNRHIYAHSVTNYGGVTLQNKRKPICRAVTLCTESEPRHPMTFHSVVLTQKSQGGHNHA